MLVLYRQTGSEEADHFRGTFFGPDDPISSWDRISRNDLFKSRLRFRVIEFSDVNELPQIYDKIKINNMFLAVEGLVRKKILTYTSSSELDKITIWLKDMLNKYLNAEPKKTISNSSNSNDIEIDDLQDESRNDQSHPKEDAQEDDAKEDETKEDEAKEDETKEDETKEDDTEKETKDDEEPEEIEDVVETRNLKKKERSEKKQKSKEVEKKEDDGYYNIDKISSYAIGGGLILAGLILVGGVLSEIYSEYYSGKGKKASNPIYIIDDDGTPLNFNDIPIDKERPPAKIVVTKAQVDASLGSKPNDINEPMSVVETEPLIGVTISSDIEASEEQIKGNEKGLVEGEL